MGHINIYLLVAYGCAIFHTSATREYPPASIHNLLTLQAERPYQYRALIPAVCWIANKIIPVDSTVAALLIDTVFLAATFVALFGTLRHLHVPVKWAVFLPMLLVWQFWFNTCAYQTELFLRY